MAALIIIKIVGIALLIPVSLIILVTLLLCVPVKYSGAFRYDSKLTGSAEITYFFRIISLIITYNDKGLRSVIKIFGRSWRKKHDTDKAVEREHKDAAEERSDEIRGEVTDEPDPAGFVDEEGDEIVNKKTRRTKVKKSKQAKNRKAKKNKTKQDDTEEKPKSGFSSLIDFIKGLKEHEIKPIMSVTLKYLRKLIKACLPSEIKALIRIGFEDPSLTGTVLAAVYPVLGMSKACKSIVLQGNFQEPELKTDASLSGRLYIIKILVLLCMYALSKPIWPLVKNFLFRKDESE